MPRPPAHRSRALGALIALVTLTPGGAQALCEPPPGHPIALLSAERDPLYDGLFALQPEGWLGGDIGHSIPLGDGRVLWLFGDTFVGTSTGGVRDGGATIINGSIAIQDRSGDAVGSVAYHLGDDPTGFFAHQSPPSAGSFYWTTQGVAFEGAVYIFAMNVVSLFEQEGLSIIKVPNPEDPPEAWRQEVTYVPLGDTARMYHAGLLIEGGDLYLMGFDDSLGARRTVLAKLPLTALVAGATREDFLFYTQGDDGPEWSVDEDDLVTLIPAGVTESSLTYDADLGLYLYVTYDAFAGDLSLSAAPSITGPWSAPACVFHVPEVDRPRMDVLAYAGRLHPELSPGPGEIVLSYVTNTWGTISPLFTPSGADLYIPRFVRLTVAVPDPPTPTPSEGETPSPSPTPTADPTGPGCATAPAGPPPWLPFSLMAALLGRAAWGARRRARQIIPARAPSS